MHFPSDIQPDDTVATNQAPSTNTSKTNFFIAYSRLPIIIAISVSVGMYIGSTLFGSQHVAKGTVLTMKFKEIFGYIEDYYVDTVDMNKVAEVGIKKMLEELDPHTIYIPASDVKLSNAPLEGDFEGIGIEFNIFKDTLVVIAPMPNSPSEEVGLQSGDKIVSVDGESIVATKLSNKDVFKKLRGKAGSAVRLGVIRGNSKAQMYFTVTRKHIPTYTVDACYLLNKETGYIKISRFGAKTYDEFASGLEKLLSQGMTQLVLDLRDNPGGYLSACTKIVDEFLPNQQLIVYTEGKEDRFNSKEFATGAGRFEKGKVMVLIDEGSASASEIVAGALQDQDRALIVGRRSFGKGLVQKPVTLNDSSELRITISRYYTPSGRSIQKKYEHGDSKSYQAEMENRYKHGELYYADSIKFDEHLRYKTTKGRTVYGGGGIMPDIFIAQDTAYLTPYLSKLYAENLVREYAMQYANTHRKRLQQMMPMVYVSQFQLSEEEMKQFIQFGAKNGVAFNEKDYNTSKKFLKNQLKALIARSIWSNEDAFYRIIGQEDDELQKALEHFSKYEQLLKVK